MALVNYQARNILGVTLSSGEIVRFIPGINEVEDSKFELIKTHPLFQARIKAGLIKILTDAIGKDGKRSVEDMLTYIPGIYDTRLLKKIIESDGRDKVVSAAREQLEKIKNPAKAKEDSENEHFT